MALGDGVSQPLCGSEPDLISFDDLPNEAEDLVKPDTDSEPHPETHPGLEPFPSTNSKLEPELDPEHKPKSDHESKQEPISDDKEDPEDMPYEDAQEEFDENHYEDFNEHQAISETRSSMPPSEGARELREIIKAKKQENAELEDFKDDLLVILFTFPEGLTKDMLVKEFEQTYPKKPYVEDYARRFGFDSIEQMLCSEDFEDTVQMEKYEENEEEVLRFTGKPDGDFLMDNIICDIVKSREISYLKKKKELNHPRNRHLNPENIIIAIDGKSDILDVAVELGASDTWVEFEDIRRSYFQKYKKRLDSYVLRKYFHTDVRMDIFNKYFEKEVEFRSDKDGMGRNTFWIKLKLPYEDIKSEWDLTEAEAHRAKKEQEQKNHPRFASNIPSTSRDSYRSDSRTRPVSERVSVWSHGGASRSNVSLTSSNGSMDNAMSRDEMVANFGGFKRETTRVFYDKRSSCLQKKAAPQKPIQNSLRKEPAKANVAGLQDVEKAIIIREGKVVRTDYLQDLEKSTPEATQRPPMPKVLKASMSTYRKISSMADEDSPEDVYDDLDRMNAKMDQKKPQDEKEDPPIEVGITSSSDEEKMTKEEKEEKDDILVTRSENVTKVLQKHSTTSLTTRGEGLYTSSSRSPADDHPPLQSKPEVKIFSRETTHPISLSPNNFSSNVSSLPLPSALSSSKYTQRQIQVFKENKDEFVYKNPPKLEFPPRTTSTAAPEMPLTSINPSVNNEDIPTFDRESIQPISDDEEEYEEPPDELKPPPSTESLNIEKHEKFLDERSMEELERLNRSSSGRPNSSSSHGQAFNQQQKGPSRLLSSSFEPAYTRNSNITRQRMPNQYPNQPIYEQRKKLATSRFEDPTPSMDEPQEPRTRFTKSLNRPRREAFDEEDQYNPPSQRHASVSSMGSQGPPRSILKKGPGSYSSSIASNDYHDQTGGQRRSGFVDEENGEPTGWQGRTQKQGPRPYYDQQDEEKFPSVSIGKVDLSKKNTPTKHGWNGQFSGQQGGIQGPSGPHGPQSGFQNRPLRAPPPGGYPRNQDDTFARPRPPQNGLRTNHRPRQMVSEEDDEEDRMPVRSSRPPSRSDFYEEPAYSYPQGRPPPSRAIREDQRPFVPPQGSRLPPQNFQQDGYGVPPPLQDAYRHRGQPSYDPYAAPQHIRPTPPRLFNGMVPEEAEIISPVYPRIQPSPNSAFQVRSSPSTLYGTTDQGHENNKKGVDLYEPRISRPQSVVSIRNVEPRMNPVVPDEKEWYHYTDPRDKLKYTIKKMASQNDLMLADILPEKVRQCMGSEYVDPINDLKTSWRRFLAEYCPFVTTVEVMPQNGRGPVMKYLQYNP